jgi:hypothetical protein
MLHSGRTRLLAVLYLMVAAVPALAAPAMAKTMKAKITIGDTVTLSGHEIKPGDYSVVVDDNKVSLLQKGKVVAEAPAQWVDSKNRDLHTSVVVNGGEVKEIHFEGKKSHLVIQ